MTLIIKITKLQENTGGENCDSCALGFYKDNASIGSMDFLEAPCNACKACEGPGIDTKQVCVRDYLQAIDLRKSRSYVHFDISFFIKFDFYLLTLIATSDYYRTSISPFKNHLIRKLNKCKENGI